MNRHIERLLESAPYTTISTEGRLFSQRDMAVFAELIVRECLQISDNFEIDVNQIGLVSRIARHFGVDE